MKKPLIVLATGLTALALLTACVPTPPPPTSSSQRDDDDEADVEETEEDAPQQLEQSDPIEVSGSVTDDVLEHVITVHNVVRNFPIPEDFPVLIENGDEIVLLDVTFQSGEVYYGGVGPLSLDLITESGDEGVPPGQPSTIADEEIAAAGFDVIEGFGADTGETVRGWMAFVLSDVDPDEPLIVRYQRLAANGSDGTTIPEKFWEIPLDL